MTNRHTGRTVVVDDAKKSRPWKQEVRATAAAHLNGRPLLDGPLILTVTFFLQRPKGHWGSGRNADRVRPTAPAYPTTRPDTTKLLRAVEDALTGVVYRDDAQIVDQLARKVFGEPERCEITLRQIGGNGAAIPARVVAG